jgi:hypothetical protein
VSRAEAMHPLTRLLWRAARDSADGLGLSLEEASYLCGAATPQRTVLLRLYQMTQRGYLMRVGPNTAKRWIPNLNVPEGESSTVGAPTTPTRSALARPFEQLQAEDFTHQLGGVPNSVWKLAQLVANSAGTQA